MRNAAWQQWETLLRNRRKRTRAGLFLVQGVRPINLALEHGWAFDAILVDIDRDLSSWARDTIDAAGCDTYLLTPDLMADLGEKDDGPPELIAVVSQRRPGLDSLSTHEDFLGVVFDRPSSPGNLGSVVRSADAFGADAVMVTGHAADPYDPQAVRASTGSLFSLPVLADLSTAEILAWAADSPVRPTVIGTDEHGEVELSHQDLTGPVLLVVGNEAAGMSQAWREGADRLASIPIGGSASSLNAASAASVCLYEAVRQRRL